ncbi:MAG: enoyl-[acyl-carrier-protein] reductase FabK [Firmicutes bacterium]|nr:enoyl-[acyl-carrier-protein] reductase FabK [Bacillota bacterium]
MIKTEICSLLNIKYPILQGGMAWIATGELAAAVSNAGGLGIIGSGNAPAEIIKKEILKIKNSTDKPFALNVMLLSPFVDEIIELIYEEKVPIVSFGAGNPSKYIKKLKKNNIKVIPIVPSVALAKRMENSGADAVIVEGTEAGGHIGETTTMALVPQVVDAVKIPVIAAGGIADGRGFISALALGAQGVQMGTIFVCSKECTVHNNYKNAIIKAGDRSTSISGKTTGHPVRMIKNKLYREFIKLERVGVPIEELEKLGEGSLRKACVEGDVDTGTVMAGQISGIVKEIKTVKDIIDGIIEESYKVIKKVNKIVG